MQPSEIPDGNSGMGRMLCFKLLRATIPGASSLTSYFLHEQRDLSEQFRQEEGGGKEHLATLLAI